MENIHFEGYATPPGREPPAIPALDPPDGYFPQQQQLSTPMTLSTLTDIYSEDLWLSVVTAAPSSIITVMDNLGRILVTTYTRTVT